MRALRASSSRISCSAALIFCPGAEEPLEGDAAAFLDDLKTFETGAGRLSGLEKPSLTCAGTVEEAGGEVVSSAGGEGFLRAPKDREILVSGSRTSSVGPVGSAEASPLPAS